MRGLVLGAIVLASALMGVGCSSGEAPMSAADAANFNGKKDGGPPSEAKKKAMADFQANFQRLHPSNGAPGAPPPGK